MSASPSSTRTRQPVGRPQGRPHPRRHRRRRQEGRAGRADRHRGRLAQQRRGGLGDGIDVAVYNGTTTRGLASRAATALTEHGFTVTRTANAVDRDRADTVIEYGAGLRARAQTVARLFPGAALNSVPGAGVNVVVGESYKGGSTASPQPTAIPKDVTEDARSADDNPCSNLTYG